MEKVEKVAKKKKKIARKESSEPSLSDVSPAETTGKTDESRLHEDVNKRIWNVAEKYRYAVSKVRILQFKNLT